MNRGTVFSTERSADDADFAEEGRWRLEASGLSSPVTRETQLRSAAAPITDVRASVVRRRRRRRKVLAISSSVMKVTFRLLTGELGLDPTWLRFTLSVIPSPTRDE